LTENTRFAYIGFMNTIKEWVSREGRSGRQKLAQTIKSSFPRTSEQSISNYIHGQRTMPYEIALIFSEICGIPLSRLPYRYVHRPDPLDALRDGKN
jgi:hypothetical protein